MSGKKRKAGDMDILNRPQLLEKIKSMTNTRNRALASFIYLTGARISEILGTKKFIKHYKIIGKDNNGKNIKQLERTEEVDIPPLKKENIEVLEDKNLILVHQVACLKHKTDIPKRTIPIVISKDIEFIKLFMDHWVTLLPTMLLFRMTRQNAWRIINKELKLYNHFLIHERCTHLVTSQAFTDLDLKQFRGWTDARPASIYTHLKWQDIAEKMK